MTSPLLRPAGDCRSEHLASGGSAALEDLEIGKILGSASCLLGENQVVPGQKGDFDRSQPLPDPPSPSRAELKTGNRRHQVDAIGWITQLDELAGLGEVGAAKSQFSEAEIVQRQEEPVYVLGFSVDPEVDVLGVARSGMVRERVSANDEGSNLPCAEALEQFLEARRQVHPWPLGNLAGSLPTRRCARGRSIVPRIHDPHRLARRKTRLFSTRLGSYSQSSTARTSDSRAARSGGLAVEALSGGVRERATGERSSGRSSPPL